MAADELIHIYSGSFLNAQFISNVLDENNIKCAVDPSNLDEDEVKKSLINQGATPELISKNLAELKANKVSQKKIGEIVLGADSVIDFCLLYTSPSPRDRG